jgi:hypothetical protein
MATLNRREKFQSMGYRGATSERARKTRTYPLRKVLDDGIGLDPDRPNADVDALECGHFLSGAEDIIGRRYPARRRCHKCAKEAEQT